MKGIIGMSAAGLVVVLQLAGFAVWRVEPATYLAPIEGPAVTNGHRA